MRETLHPIMKVVILVESGRDLMKESLEGIVGRTEAAILGGEKLNAYLMSVLSDYLMNVLKEYPANVLSEDLVNVLREYLVNVLRLE